jgi:hypothetical protein
MKSRKTSNIDSELFKLHQAFGEDYPEYYEYVSEIFSEVLGREIKPENNPMKVVIDLVFELDHIDALIKLFEYNENMPQDYFYIDFEEGDWFEDNEDQRALEAEYGEEGYKYYEVHTKTKIHVFQEMKPFSNGLEYTETKERF